MKLIKPSYQILTPIDGKTIYFNQNRVANYVFTKEERIAIWEKFFENDKKIKI